MKKTLRRIMALIFSVIMVSTLSVPAFASEPVDDITVTIIAPVVMAEKTENDNVRYEYAANGSIKINLDSNAALESVEDIYLDQHGMDVEVGDTLNDVLRSLNSKGWIDYSSSKSEISNVNGNNTLDMEETDAEGRWVASVNGKIIENANDYIMQESDSIVIYWYDEILDTKLILADYSEILTGVVSYYYYDVEGNRQPVVGLNVALYKNSNSKQNALENKLNELEPGADLSEINPTFDKEFWDNYYTTDEDGQIWIAPEHLASLDKDGLPLYVMSAKTTMNGEARDRNYPAAKYGVKVTSDDYDEDLAEYYAIFGRCGSITTMVITEKVKLADVAQTAYDIPNTGDMTFVYVLVAAVAVVTLGAVVIMKKKASKAN